MKTLKHIGAAFLLLLGLGQILPICLISSGLFQSQYGDDMSYFIGKLIGHVFVAVLLLALAYKLFKSARKRGERREVSV